MYRKAFLSWYKSVYFSTLIFRFKESQRIFCGPALCMTYVEGVGKAMSGSLPLEQLENTLERAIENVRQVCSVCSGRSC
jgi:hypothetical protein